MRKRKKMNKTEQVAYPIGLTVTGVRMMTKLELEAEGWENYYGGYPVAVIFNDGSKIYASSDPEGNNVGCIFGLTSKGESIIVSPLDDAMIKEGKTS
jgi:hypothetical protein